MDILPPPGVGDSPYTVVKNRGQFPVDLYTFQQRSVEDLAPLDRLALYYDPGCGKTLTSLAIGVYKLLTGMCDTVLIIVPPVLLINWSRNIARIPNTTQVVYGGTPAQRKRLNLDAQFIVVGVQIFKRDYAYLSEHLGQRRVFGIVDEAQMLKNPSSDNFRKVRDFHIGQQICLLTGTPISVPTDAYALIKLVSPTLYKTQYQFESIHVEERDFFGHPTKYANLELLSENLVLNAHRVLKEDVLLDLPEVTYTPIYYDLTTAHLKLYQRLADEQMVKLENGEKVDLTNASALWHAMSQVPCNAEYFSQGSTTSTVLDVVDAVLNELGGRKLVIFTHYVMTTERLIEHLASVGVASVYGKTKDRQAEIDRFIADPQCRVLVLNLKAGGAGIDGLQAVCHDALFVELPTRADPFRQAYSRLHRDGQLDGVNVRVALANQTLNIRNWEYVQDNDSLVNSVVRGPQDIRAALAGR